MHPTRPEATGCRSSRYEYPRVKRLGHHSKRSRRPLHDGQKERGRPGSCSGRNHDEGQFASCAMVYGPTPLELIVHQIRLEPLAIQSHQNPGQRIPRHGHHPSTARVRLRDGRREGGFGLGPSEDQERRLGSEGLVEYLQPEHHGLRPKGFPDLGHRQPGECFQAAWPTSGCPRNR